MTNFAKRLTGAPYRSTQVVEADDAAEVRADVERGKRREKWIIHTWQIVILAIIICGWQYIPMIPNIRRTFTFEDPFFISSPSRLAKQLWDSTTGAGGNGTIWHNFFRTIVTALMGTAAGLIVGMAAGLVLSQSARWAAIARPFVSFFNAIPRITIIPVIVLVVGTGETGSAVSSFTVVVFLVFYTAFEGSGSIPVEVIQNAKLLGAKDSTVMFKVRLPFVLGWVFGVLPLAIAFGLIGAVTSEILTGSEGLGRELTYALNTANATETFAIVTILAVTGVILSFGSAYLRKRLLPWWEGAR